MFYENLSNLLQETPTDPNFKFKKYNKFIILTDLTPEKYKFSAITLAEYKREYFDSIGHIITVYLPFYMNKKINGATCLFATRLTYDQKRGKILKNSAYENSALSTILTNRERRNKYARIIIPVAVLSKPNNHAIVIIFFPKTNELLHYDSLAGQSKDSTGIFKPQDFVKFTTSWRKMFQHPIHFIDPYSTKCPVLVQRESHSAKYNRTSEFDKDVDPGYCMMWSNLFIINVIQNKKLLKEPKDYQNLQEEMVNSIKGSYSVFMRQFVIYMVKHAKTFILELP